MLNPKKGSFLLSLKFADSYKDNPKSIIGTKISDVFDKTHWLALKETKQLEKKESDALKDIRAILSA